MGKRIRNVQILQNGSFVPGSVEYDRKILSVQPAEAAAEGADTTGDSLNGEGGYLIPGLVDVHTHGAMNADASDGDAEGLRIMMRYYAAGGVTSFCPTTMTLPEDVLMKAVTAIRDVQRPQDGAKVAGIHLEGPFLNMEKCGAQNPAYIAAPDIRLFQRLQEASSGLVRLITVAPETEGAVPFIREAAKECTVSLGHTMADYETAMAAYEAGASHTTHLFNAMPGMEHRKPGVILAAHDAGARVELICDGVHIHPAVVRMTHALFGERLLFISDSVRCAGMPDGDYDLGGLPITVKDHRATLKGTDTIAGSSIHLMDAVRCAVSFGIPLADAVTAATRIPAEAIGMEGEIGDLSPGKSSDMVLLDKELAVKAVFIEGERI